MIREVQVYCVEICRNFAAIRFFSKFNVYTTIFHLVAFLQKSCA